MVVVGAGSSREWKHHTTLFDFAEDVVVRGGPRRPRRRVFPPPSAASRRLSVPVPGRRRRSSVPSSPTSPLVRPRTPSAPFSPLLHARTARTLHAHAQQQQRSPARCCPFVVSRFSTEQSPSFSYFFSHRSTPKSQTPPVLTPSAA